MRIAATLVAVALASGCAGRLDPPMSDVGRMNAPVNYEATVTTYFDLTTRTPVAQRKISFGSPEASGCRLVGNQMGWVVPVTFQVTAPPPGSAAAAAPAPAAAAPVPAATPALAKAAPVAAKSKGKTKGKQKDTPVVVMAAAAPNPPRAAVVEAPAPPPGGVALEEVSVTGITRHFFWFNKETINAVTRRMDICP